MKRSGWKWRLCLATLLLALSTTSWSEAAGWVSVPKGWKAPEAGCFGDEPTARETLESLRIGRETADAWERAYRKLRDENIGAIEKGERDLEALKEAIEAERFAARTAVARERRNALWCILGGVAVGILIGGR